MKSAIAIRGYESGDRDRCRALWKELTDRHREIYHDPGIGGEHPEDFFDKHLAQVGSGQLWVAVSGSTVIGLVGLIFKEKEAQIEPLIVAKSSRGRGVGKQLIEKAISEAKSKGVSLLTVSPVARNVEAVRLFYKMGFHNLGFLEMFIDFSGRSWKLGPNVLGCKFNY
ncbi:MAG: GNAT family N-acetyltransferase [Promethearchaeati archaeon SRVP18_Atabeyarchaeia-1]